ncbi:hypothetical protein [Pseudarthrobacter sp. NamE5]|uniref:sunset domain-containing protein n=1 Tax=Pseudarthrobacter sp. NamE5 TaxID=2576839 RepID=UPI001F0FACAA|nr:hypothetical protein [Pseudarthrobacter sp. NamE5]
MEIPTEGLDVDLVFWIILIVLLAGVVWWLLNRSRASKDGTSSRAPGAPGTQGSRADGALSAGGGTGVSAEAAGTTGIASAAGFGRAAEPAAPATAEEPAETAAAPAAAGGPGSTGADSFTSSTASREEHRRRDEAEWETQWSEASGSGSSAVPQGSGGNDAIKDTAGKASGGTEGRGQESAAAMAGASAHRAEAAPVAGPAEPAPDAAAAGGRPVHHPEYTDPHAPTLPGAETAAVEDLDDAGTEVSAPTPARPATTGQGMAANQAPDSGQAGAVPAAAAAAETADRTQSSALVEAGADHTGEPQSAPAHEAAGHLAAEEPYGAGSAAPAADGSGPADYRVKGDAGAMVYYGEEHPDYDQARADVWFESEAHAEAAGFRAPRRKRL